MLKVENEILKNFSKLRIGDWDENTVRLDYDHESLNEVKFYAFKTISWFELGGFLILRSSQRTMRVRDKITKKILFSHKVSNYHVVFDKYVSWSLNVKIMNWAALQSKNEALKDYVRMQCIKETSTLRLTDTKIVFRYGNQNHMIKKFLENKQFIQDFLNTHKVGVNTHKMGVNASK